MQKTPDSLRKFEKKATSADYQHFLSKDVTAILINFIVDFKTTLFANLCFSTYGYEVLQRRSACLVDRCGMLSPRDI